MWCYMAQVDEGAPLYVHIDMSWGAFRAHKDCLLQLKKQVTVDVFLGYRSNCDHSGIEVPYQSLAMFVGAIRCLNHSYVNVPEKRQCKAPLPG
jgi:hypothetical protein